MKLKLTKIHVIILILIIAGILWKAYPHILVPRIFPSDEYINIGYVLWLVQQGGNPYDAFRNPHLGYFLVYFIHIIFKIDVYQIMFKINPIISGLTVIPFFLFASKILNNKRQALIATILFTFSETMFYRTCHYGSNEALGLFLMFTYLAVYLHATRLRQKLLSIPILIMIPFGHVLPFIFAVVFTILDLIQKRRKIVLLALLIGSIIFIFNPIAPPHRFLFEGVPASLSSFSIGKLFIYSPTDIIENVLFLMGFAVMLFLCIFSWKPASKTEKMLLLCMFVGFLASIFIYNVKLLGPTRLLAYISIPLFTMTARILSKERIIITILVSLMIMGPIIGGTDKFVWTSDSITQEEMEVIEFLFNEQLINSSRGSYNYPTYWFADSVARQYMTLTCGAGGTYYYPEQWFYSHVFLSERMEQQALFFELQENDRTLEIRTPVLDIWANNQTGWQDRYSEHSATLLGWKLLYNIKGVKVYEAVYVFDK